LWGENWIVIGEMACPILDLELFDALNLNIRPDKILLIRNEYVSAYNYFLTRTLKMPILRRATLVTGQPGIGASTLECMALADLT
jgi:hypothetical protein